MAVYGFIVKVLVVSLTSVSVLSSPSSGSETPTHLISVDYSSYPYTHNNDENKPPDDVFGQESVKIENRQLYDTVKHASGYDPDAAHNNNSRNTNEETNDKVNSSSVKIFIPPRKSSAVIQAIPRKVRGPGSTSSTSSTTSTTTSSPFARPPSLHTTAKDYGTGEPTTTIVYATSIPTSPSRTYVNIRPVPLLSTQKYRSTVAEGKQEKSQERDTSKPVMEKFSDDEQQQGQKPQVNVVLEKPAFKIDSSPEQATTAPGTYDPAAYHIEQRKRNFYKSVPYARVRTNEDVDKIAAYNRNAFVNPYPNHKWESEDYMQRMSPPPPPPPPQFVYENHQNPQQNYYHPAAVVNQNPYPAQYPPPDEYQDDMYRVQPSPVFIPQHQQPTRQQYQPLTVRDFDLLLQLLVLRERRLHAAQDPYPSPVDYTAGQDPNYYYDMPKAPNPAGFYKSREPKFIESSLPRSSAQPPSTRLLPSNVREELLFRMLLLALHLQPQPQPKPMSVVPRNPPPVLPAQYMYLGSSSPPPPAPAAATFLGFRQRGGGGGGVSKNPVRSVQVLGEID